MEAASPQGSDQSQRARYSPAVATSIDKGEIRAGSPFAPGTAIAGGKPGSVTRDSGAASEVARGAVWAAWLILPFAAATAWPFPLGGALITGLGVALSLMGLTSPRPLWAIAALSIHIVLLAVSLLPVL